MIEERATVVAIAGELAEVTTERHATCGSCSARSGCGTSLLASVFGRHQTSLRVLNRIQAQPGDRVVVGLAEQAMLRSALALYALPLLAMILVAIAGQALFEYLQLELGELGVIAGGLLGLLAGLGWARRFAGRVAGRETYQARILRRAEVPAAVVRVS